MIETEDQRRWWFATHPEYSWSRRGIGTSERERSGSRIDPKEVDKYVDRALKYETGPVADLLKSVKKHFGTEGSSQKRDKSAVLGGIADASGANRSTAESRPEDDPDYWEGYYTAQKLIWNKEKLPPCDPNDNSPYALGFGKGVLAAYRQAEAAAKLWQVFHDTWDTLTSWLPFIGSSRTLGKNLEKAGISKQEGHASHHIVAENDRRAENAKKILDKFGIKIDDAENGIPLPYKTEAGTGTYHPGVHTTKYYQEVEKLLSQASTREEAIAILKDIRSRLSKGTFPK